MEVVLSIHDGTPNANGIIYNEMSLKEMPNDIPIFAHSMFANPLSGCSMEHCLGFVNLVEDHDGIIMGVLSERTIDRIKLEYDDVSDLFMCMSGRGTVGKDKVITELVYESAFLACTHADSRVKPLNFEG